MSQKINKNIDCSCGCNTCDNNKVITLNESFNNSKLTLSEGVQYIYEHNINLLENIYRYGSKQYLSTLREVRNLYSKNLINLNEENTWLITETQIGEFGYYEGKLVPLDIIFEEEIMGGKANNLTLKQISKITSFNYDQLKINFILGTIHELEHTKNIKQAQEICKDHLIEDPLYYTKLNSIVENKKTPILNKPKRSSGPKKYYVYTRNPKTKKIIKVNFGDSGNLSAKISNPKARKSFVARHKCNQKNDRTKPGYWSCRLPRYAKGLNIKGGGNFMW